MKHQKLIGIKYYRDNPITTVIILKISY